MKFLVKASAPFLAFALVGCESTAGLDNSTGTFGYATTQNALVQSGEGLQDLNARFAQDVQTMVNFEFNRSELDATARASLDRQAQFINGFPMIKFRVYGYTDQVGSEGYNQALGMRRAQAATSYLISRGVSSSRVEAVVSGGESNPLVNSGGPERLNRRAVTQVAGMAPGYNNFDFDGKRAAAIYAEYVADKGSEVTPAESTAPQ